MPASQRKGCQDAGWGALLIRFYFGGHSKKARRAALSKDKDKDVKRGKRPGEWVDLHARPHKLEGRAQTRARLRENGG